MTPRRSVAATIVIGLLVSEVIVLSTLAFFPYIPDMGFAAINMSIYTILAPLSAVFLLGVLYAWVVRLGTREARRRSARFNKFLRFLSEPFQNIESSVTNAYLFESAHSLKILSRPRLIIVLSLVVSILLVFIPYRPDLNPTGALVGIDSPLYVSWIGQMLARPLPQALQYSFVEGLEGSRPFLLIPMYLLASAGASPSQIIQYLPMLFAPALTVSTYVFVRYGHGSSNVAGLTSLFTSVSFYSTVGLWGGYYANWLALILVYLFMTSLLIFSKAPRSSSYVAMYFLSIALFLTHPWTWVLVAAVALVFAITLWRETHESIHARSIIGIMASGVILDVAKSWIFATRTVTLDIATKSPAGMGSLLGFWNNLVEALLFTHGGLMADWLVLGLGLLAVFLLRFRDPFERLLFLWVAVPSIPFLVLDSYSQARILYDFPIPVLTSLATVILVPVVGTKSTRWPGLVLILLMTVIVNYALQGILLI
jgi:hypothetical protein